ncbi:MAG: DUF1990 domain-containing protein [Actinomycetota bacterium]|nr:DUF1990 domain-containing protein [Actinomycetota bacterium]
MTAARKPESPADRLAGLALTYREVGATAAELPGGYSHLEVDGVLGHGRPTHRRAVEALMTWQMHQRAGLSPQVDATRASVGGHVVQRIGAGRFRVGVPCRVVAVVDEPDRGGFAYGSLPGHPVRGEERFVVSIDDQDLVHLSIRAFSQPAIWYARLGGPLLRPAQRLAARWYVRALRKASAPSTP